MATVQRIDQPSKAAMAANIGLWVLQVLLALAFLAAGAAKLSGAPMMVENFAKLGLGQWFRYLTGILEVLAGVLLLIPRMSGFGAVLLLPIMIGATIVHLVVTKDSPAAPLILLALAAVVVWGRRSQILGLIGRAPESSPG